MIQFEFVDDLPRRSGGDNGGGRPPDPLVVEFAQALRATPGQWAKWPKSNSAYNSLRTMASAITRDVHPCPVALRGGCFEAKTRGGVMYVRFTGGAIS
jgi:hypothetical protein